MAQALWVYPGPPDPTLRMAVCSRDGSKYTDAADATSLCPLCGLNLKAQSSPPPAA